MDDVATVTLPTPNTRQKAAPEAVRLVVWDLDETFWRGTLTEGGIREYLQEHHDIIVTLARRGIMSSVCSKNDEATVLKILEEKGILDYIIFPSIDWTPKGARLAGLVETVQLRPATVLFIDDNPNNLAEAQAAVPGLQVASETAIAGLLADPRCKGKDDASLTRLAQYKLLETRKRDEQKASGDNTEFLRGCDVRVYIEEDVLAHLDRAIELVNRTNQLNFTKKRLSEDMATARASLTAQLGRVGARAGLVRVMDKYGDYGFVGFFLTLPGRKRLEPGLSIDHLEHFCFSCRTLGMLVEQWMFNALRRPELTVVGEVLTDLSVERRIDWVREVASLDGDVAAKPSIAPEIRIHGGCEATSVAHYLGMYSGTVNVSGNFAAGPMFVRINSVPLVLSAREHNSHEFERHLSAMGIPAQLLGGGYFDAAPENTLFVFSGAYDAESAHPRYRHRTGGWTLKLEVNGKGAINLSTAPEEEIGALLAQPHFARTRDSVLAILDTIRKEYEPVTGPVGDELSELMRRFIGLVPVGSRIVFMLDDERWRIKDGTLKAAPWITRYNALLRATIAKVPFAAAVSFGDCIQCDDEVLVGGNHYDRRVYARMADLIARIAEDLPMKDN
jgi:FkbH-like protein